MEIVNWHMEELTHILQLSVLALEIMAVIVGAYYYKKYDHTVLKYILPYLVFVVIMEVFGVVLLKSNLDNRWLYNVLGMVEYSFILFIYYKLILSRFYKRIILSLTLLFYLIFISNFLFFQKSFLVYNTFGFTMGSLFIAGVICLFFQETLNTERVLHLKYMLITWSSVGFLFYYICGLPLTSVVNNLEFIMKDSDINLMVFQYVAGIVMYITIILGFIWSKKEHNY